MTEIIEDEHERGKLKCKIREAEHQQGLCEDRDKEIT
jgi:hypothetical protein